MPRTPTPNRPPSPHFLAAIVGAVLVGIAGMLPGGIAIGTMLVGAALCLVASILGSYLDGAA